MYDRIASKIDGIANSLESKGFLKEAEELDTVSNTVEAYAIDPRAPQARKANYEFIRRLKRRTDDPQMNEPIDLPNGLSFSIQASQKHNCIPQKDLPNPGDYDAYEVAVGLKGKQLRDWLVVPGFEQPGGMGRWTQNILSRLPAAKVEQMFQTAKRLGPNEVKAMVQRAQQQRAAWDKQEETEQMEKYGGSESLADKYSGLKYACAEAIDKIAGRLESKGLVREAEELDIVSNTIEAAAAQQDAEAAVGINKFALRQAKPDFVGTKLSRAQMESLRKEAERQIRTGQAKLGYADFVRIARVKDPNIKCPIAKITPQNEPLLKTRTTKRRDFEEEYEQRYFEAKDVQPIPSDHVDVVLYSKAQLEKEPDGRPTGADWDIITFNAEPTPAGTPMAPETIRRNIKGIKGGGSGHQHTPEELSQSEAFWNSHAMIM